MQARSLQSSDSKVTIILFVVRRALVFVTDSAFRVVLIGFRVVHIEFPTASSCWVAMKQCNFNWFLDVNVD